MRNMNRRSVVTSAAALSAAALVSNIVKPTRAQADAQPSYTASDLNGALTPLGAERAGNADGSIPAWTGGYSTVPSGYKSGDVRPIPFADETPLFSITPANYAKYQDKLAAGQIQFFKQFPDFRMDVYQTHRTALAPQFVYDNTVKNVATAQMAADGNSVTGAMGGVPFPIPQNGHEVVWNHILRWKGTTTYNKGYQYVMTAGGQLVLESLAEGTTQSPYFINSSECPFEGYYLQLTVDPIAPPYQAGGAVLQLQPVNPLITAGRNWIYLPGERRTRAAPELQYDTPISFCGGAINWDEYELLYGALDQYDFNLLGKKEIYVPYNMNKAWAAPEDVQFKPKFHNPDIARWELHRVWVVELTVKQGKRNVDARRVLYIDEDSWSALLSDIYDANNSLWRFQTGIPAILPDIPCVLGSTYAITYDFHAGTYAVINGKVASIQASAYNLTPINPPSFYTPGQLSALAGAY